MAGDSLPSIIKQVYYDQQLLKLADFLREQSYHIAWRELATQQLFTAGVLTGLEVSSGTSLGTVVLSAGAAIDASGRIILLTDQLLFDGQLLTAGASGFVIDLSAPRYYTVDATRNFRLSLSFYEAAVSGTSNQSRQIPILACVNADTSDGAVPIAGITVTANSTAVLTIGIDSSLGVSTKLRAARLPAIPASTIQGTLGSAQIPSLDASKISGVFSADRIPNLDASKISGTLSVAQIPNLAASKITGTLSVAQIPDLDAAKITGTLAVTQIPNLDASKITGTLAVTQIPDLDAAKITGTLAVTQIPDLDAAKITGTLAVTQIPDLDAAKITGTLAVAQIPDLDAAKITGSLSASQIPSIDASKITGALAAAQIPSLQTLSGQLTVGQLPLLPATQLDGQLSAEQVSGLQDLIARVDSLDRLLNSTARRKLSGVLQVDTEGSVTLVSGQMIVRLTYNEVTQAAAKYPLSGELVSALGYRIAPSEDIIPLRIVSQSAIAQRAYMISFASPKVSSLDNWLFAEDELLGLI